MKILKLESCHNRHNQGAFDERCKCDKTVITQLLVKTGGKSGVCEKKEEKLHKQK